MALSQSSLESALLAVFSAFADSPGQAASDMAQAYYDYASAGMFGSSAPTLTVAQKAALTGTLLGAIADPTTGNPATLAAAWASGVAAFWTGVPVTGAQSGTTAGCPGAASLTASLTAVFAVTNGTSASAAQAVSLALHAATLTTTATVTPPPGTVLTIA